MYKSHINKSVLETPVFLMVHRREFLIYLRSCGKYVKWKHAIRKRGKGLCAICKKKGKYPVDTDHIYPLNRIMDDFMGTYTGGDAAFKAMNFEKFWDLSNGRVLCIPCHKKVTSNTHKTRIF